MGAGYFTGKRALCRLARHHAEDGELLVADPNSEENTPHKTYRFATMTQQAKGDYPFMICEKRMRPWRRHKKKAPKEALKENETSKALSSQQNRYFKRN
ncbi:MAG: hypothetical protein ACLUHE_01795 [Christensenellales bacterium]